jgi:hypothetical protein
MSKKQDSESVDRNFNDDLCCLPLMKVKKTIGPLADEDGRLFSTLL